MYSMFGGNAYKLQSYNIFPSLFFFDFATQLFSIPVTSSNLRSQASLFTELSLLQATVLYSFVNFHDDGFQQVIMIINLMQFLSFIFFVYLEHKIKRILALLLNWKVNFKLFNPERSPTWRMHLK